MGYLYLPLDPLPRVAWLHVRPWLRIDRGFVGSNCLRGGQFVHSHLIELGYTGFLIGCSWQVDTALIHCSQCPVRIRVLAVHHMSLVL